MRFPFLVLPSSCYSGYYRLMAQIPTAVSRVPVRGAWERRITTPGGSALLVMPFLGRDAVLEALSCNLEERTQNRAQVVTAPDHTQSHRGREALHRSVDHAPPVEVSQGGRDERHAYPPCDEADDGLHQPDVFLYSVRDEARLAARLGDLAVKTRHPLVACREDKRVLCERLQLDLRLRSSGCASGSATTRGSRAAHST